MPPFLIHTYLYKNNIYLFTRFSWVDWVPDPLISTFTHVWRLHSYHLILANKKLYILNANERERMKNKEEEDLNKFLN